MESIPVLPGTQARALALVHNPNVEIAAVASVVEHDPAITTALLRAANSAASAPINRVTTAERAVMRIGLHGTQQIVASSVLQSSVGDLERAGIDLDELWRHLLGCALVADHMLLARERSAGFTAGLLHDLGRLSLAQAEPESYARVVTAVRGGADPREAERTVFGDDHEQRGAAVAAAWDLPDELAEAVAHHHEPSGSLLPHAVADARRLIAAIGIGDGVGLPPAPPEELPAEDGVLLSGLGGEAALLTRLDWFQGALAAAA